MLEQLRKLQLNLAKQSVKTGDNIQEITTLMLKIIKTDMN